MSCYAFSSLSLLILLVVCLALTNAQWGRQDGGRGLGGFRDRLRDRVRGLGDRIFGGVRGGVATGEISQKVEEMKQKVQFLKMFIQVRAIYILHNI